MSETCLSKEEIRIKAITLSFVGYNGKIILEKKLTTLHLKEGFVIKKSIEFFNDPEPCMIHRSAVMKRIFIEMEDFFTRAAKEGKLQVLWNDLPYFMKEAIDTHQKVKGIIFK